MHHWFVRCLYHVSIPPDSEVRENNWEDEVKDDAPTEHEADTEQSDGEDFDEGERPGDGNEDVSKEGLEGDVVGVSQTGEDAGQQVAEHEEDVEREEDKSEVNILLGFHHSEDLPVEDVPGRDGDCPEEEDHQSHHKVSRQLLAGPHLVSIWT